MAEQYCTHGKVGPCGECQAHQPNPIEVLRTHLAESRERGHDLANDVMGLREELHEANERTEKAERDLFPVQQELGMLKADPRHMGMTQTIGGLRTQITKLEGACADHLRQFAQAAEQYGEKEAEVERLKLENASHEEGLLLGVEHVKQLRESLSGRACPDCNGWPEEANGTCLRCVADLNLLYSAPVAAQSGVESKLDPRHIPLPEDIRDILPPNVERTGSDAEILSLAVEFNEAARAHPPVCVCRGGSLVTPCPAHPDAEADDAE